MDNELPLDMILQMMFALQKQISVKDAKRFWKHISYFSMSEFINSSTTIKLIASHNGPLTLCQMSWLKVLTREPYDVNGLHVLHTYPNLKDMFLIKGVISDETPINSINDDYEGDEFDQSHTIYDSFPELKSPREPSEEETIILALYEGKFEDFYPAHDSPANQLLLARHLHHLEMVELNMTNLTTIIDQAKLLNFSHETDRQHIKYIFRALHGKLATVYANDNNIPKEMWLDIFKYLFCEPYLYQTMVNTPEFVPLVFIGESLMYLLGYPEGADPSDEVLLKDTKIMFSDVAEHQRKIRAINLANLKRYAESLPGQVTYDEDDEQLNLPPVELVFAQYKDTVKVFNRANEAHDKKLCIRFASNEYIYQQMVPTDQLSTVTELLYKMREKSYLNEYLTRVKTDFVAAAKNNNNI